MPIDIEQIVTEAEIRKNKAPFREPYLKLFYGIDMQKIKEVWYQPWDMTYHFVSKLTQNKDKENT